MPRLPACAAAARRGSGSVPQQQPHLTQAAGSLPGHPGFPYTTLQQPSLTSRGKKGHREGWEHACSFTPPASLGSCSAEITTWVRRVVPSDFCRCQGWSRSVRSTGEMGLFPASVLSPPTHRRTERIQVNFMRCLKYCWTNYLLLVLSGSSRENHDKTENVPNLTGSEKKK